MIPFFRAAFLATVLITATQASAGTTKPSATVATTSEVTLKTLDGVTVKARVEGAGTNGVLLLHDKSGSRDDWSYLSTKLAANGFRIMSLDFRGHGASHPPDTLTNADYPFMLEDVKAALTWFKSNGITKVSLVGAGLGANLALIAAANDPEVDTLVLLSPGLNLNGVTVGTTMEQYGARPVLMVVSLENQYSVRTVNFLEGKATGQKHVETLESAGSGTTMLSRSATLEGTMLAWLNGTFFEKTGQKPETEGVKTSTDTKLETSGDTLSIE